MIRIVLDTNVLMSAIFWSGIPAKILDAWQADQLKLVVSPNILEEYIRVGQILEEKYLQINIQALIDRIAIKSEILSPDLLPFSVCEDPDDDKFIETALAGNCPFIITGDKLLLKVNGFKNLKIISPSNFVKQYLPVA